MCQHLLRILQNIHTGNIPTTVRCVKDTPFEMSVVRRTNTAIKKKIANDGECECRLDCLERPDIKEDRICVQNQTLATLFLCSCIIFLYSIIQELWRSSEIESLCQLHHHNLTTASFNIIATHENRSDSVCCSCSICCYSWPKRIFCV